MDPEPTTEELRLEQLERRTTERDAAAGATDPNAVEAHTRRAEKADYLREKLDERAKSEQRED